METCMKALVRIEEKRMEARYLEDCMAYNICPRCGNDLEAITLFGKPDHYVYLCPDCDKEKIEGLKEGD